LAGSPSVVHLQAVVNGASPETMVGPGFRTSFLDLLDAEGHPITVVASDAGVNRLRFQGGGGVFTLPLSIPAT